MKIKIVVRVSMNDDKSRSKAMKIAFGISGVESAALAGEGKDEVVVVGERIDAVELTRHLRNKFAYAELVSVGEAKKEEDAAKDEDPTPQPAVVVSYVPPYDGYVYPCYPVYQIVTPSPDPSCTIM